jgi:hypothetical protein
MLRINSNLAVKPTPKTGVAGTGAVYGRNVSKFMYRS